MNYRLKSTLSEVIQKWIDEESQSDEWTDVGYIGDNLATLMTEAASTVVDCCTDVNSYHEKEGNLK